MFGSFEITSIRLYTPLRTTRYATLRGLHGVYNLMEVISSWTEQKLRSILNRNDVYMVLYKKKYHFFLIRQTAWQEQAFLFLTGQCTKIIVSETTVAIGIKLCRNGVWKLLYKKNPHFVTMWQEKWSPVGQLLFFF